jgi:hypothetical protein
LVPSSPGPLAISIANPLNDPGWDAKIASFPDATPFHTAGWMRVLKESYGFVPCCFVLGDPENPAAIQPMMEASSWATRRRGVALPFTDECSVLRREGMDCSSLSPAIQDHGRTRRWRYAQFRGLGPVQVGEPRPTGFVRHCLDLSPGAAAVHAGLDSANRRAIRKAEKEKVEVSIEATEDAMSGYYELHQITRQRHGVPPQPWRFFAAIQRHMIASGRGFISIARVNGRMVAGAVYFVFGRWAIYKFGASDERFQKYRPNNLLMWRSIEHLIAAGCAVLHFGRSALHHHGLREFKLGWGATESPLGYTTILLPEGHLETESSQPPLAERFASITSRCPRLLTRFMGAALYPHLT